MNNVEIREKHICELLNAFLCHKGKLFKEIYQNTSLSEEEAYSLIDIIEAEGLVLNLRIKRDKIKKPVIVFCDTAEVSTKGLEYIRTHSAIRRIIVDKTEVSQKPTVFLSYNWDDKEYAYDIEKNVGVVSDFHRDVNSIGNWGSIERFMRTITDHDYVILLVSKKYIESLNCMYEAWQLCVNDKWSDRVMCVVTDDVDIYSPEGKVRAVKFWVDKCEEYKTLLNSLPDDSKIGLTEDLRKMEEIRLHAGEVLRNISLRQNPSKEEAISKMCDKLASFSDQLDQQEDLVSPIQKDDKYRIILDAIDWLSQLNKYADRCSLALENSLCKANPEERWNRYSDFSSLLSEMSQEYNCFRNKYVVLLEAMDVEADIDGEFREATRTFINNLRELGNSFIHQPDTSASTEVNNKIYQDYVCAVNRQQKILAEALKM